MYVKTAGLNSLGLCCALLLIATWSEGAPLSDGGKPSEPAVTQAVERCRLRANLDACYDAIRWRPADPTLLVALGDALGRARRPADGLRAYRRAAALAPNLPGLNAKISAAEAGLTARHAPITPRSKAPAKRSPPPEDFSNTDPITSTH